MTKTSCVPRLANDVFLVIRTSYVRICRGDVTAAALIHIFERWHDAKLAARQNFIDMDERPDVKGTPPPLWQFHKNEDLEAQLMGIGKRDRVDRARKFLQELGIIDIGRNPNKKFRFDATTFYLFHPEVVTDLLLKLGPIFQKPEHPIAENSSDTVPKTGAIGAENSRAIPHDSHTHDSEENTSAPIGDGNKGLGKTANAGKKEPAPAAPPRPYWQALVDTWFDFYKLKFQGEEPNFLRRQPALFGQLVDLFESRAKKKKNEWTEAYAVKALKAFLELAYAEDWLKNHFLLENLVKQFDAVCARAAAAKVGKGNGTASKPVGLEADLKFLVDRSQDPDFDPRIVTPDYYDRMQSRDILPAEFFSKFEGDTIDEQKRQAVLYWLSVQNQPATT